MAELGDSYAYYLRKGATSVSIFASALNIGLGIYVIVLYATQNAWNVGMLAGAELTTEWGVIIGIWLLFSGLICASVEILQKRPKTWVQGLVHFIFGVPPLAVYQAPLIWIGPLFTTISAVLYFLLSWRTRYYATDEKLIPLAHSSKDQVTNYETNSVFEE